MMSLAKQERSIVVAVISEGIRVATQERPEITANEVMMLENRRSYFFTAHEALSKVQGDWK